LSLPKHADLMFFNVTCGQLDWIGV
jgi:hypothetical protein